MRIKITYFLEGENHTKYFETEEEMNEWLRDNEIYQYETNYIVYKD